MLSGRQRHIVFKKSCTIANCGHLLDIPRLVVDGRAEGIPLALVLLAAEDEGGGTAKKNLTHAR